MTEETNQPDTEATQPAAEAPATAVPQQPQLPPQLPFGMIPQTPDHSLRVQGDRIDEITDYLVALRSPQIFDTRAPFVVVPENLKVLDVEKHMPVPSRVRKSVKFTEVDSFLDYFNLFAPSYKPRLFSKITGAGIEFLAVFDYDGPGVKREDGNVSVPQPQWNTHTAFLNLNYHRDYQTLRNNADKWHEQEDFALFVEENTHLFVQPDAATMLELAQELKGHRNVGWQTGKRLADGRVRLEYIEEIEAKSVRGEMSVPESLKLVSPIFEGFSPQDINAAFRYRLDGDGGITFSYRLLTKLAERAAEDEVKKRILEETKLPIYAVSTFDGLVRANG